MDVGVHREAGGGEHALLTENALAFEPQALAEVQPLRHPALTFPGPVVIDHALRPLAAQLRVDDPGHERRVLDGDPALVVVAIERPGLELPASEAAFAHQHVEGVLVVVALGADREQAQLECLG